jgi:hypothetical protein
MRMRLPKPKTIFNDLEPLSDRGRVDMFLESAKTRQAILSEEFAKECRRDPIFLDRALKELKPLRRRGRSRPLYQEAVVHSMVNALTNHRPGEIVEAIAKTLNISPPHARRLYDSVRKSRE